MKKSKLIIELLIKELANTKKIHQQEIANLKSNHNVDLKVKADQLTLLENLIFIHGVGDKIGLLSHVKRQAGLFDYDDCDSGEYQNMELISELLSKKSSSYTAIKSEKNTSDKELLSEILSLIDNLLY